MSEYLGYTDDHDAAPGEVPLPKKNLAPPEPEYWDAAEWLYGSALVTFWPSGTLDETVRALKAEAESDGHILSGDLREALLDRAEREFAVDYDDGLTADHITALLKAGRITQEQATRRAQAQ